MMIDFFVRWAITLLPAYALATLLRDQVVTILVQAERTLALVAR